MRVFQGGRQRVTPQRGPRATLNQCCWLGQRRWLRPTGPPWSRRWPKGSLWGRYSFWANLLALRPFLGLHNATRRGSALASRGDFTRVRGKGAFCQLRADGVLRRSARKRGIGAQAVFALFCCPTQTMWPSGDSTGSSYVLYAVATALTQISLSLVFIGIVLREY